MPLKDSDKKSSFNRRDWLIGTTGLVSGVLLKTAYDAIIPDGHQTISTEEEMEEDLSAEFDAGIEVPEDATKVLGELPSELGKRSPFETPKRQIVAPAHSGYSATPLQDLNGILTPADLHFERHHGGIPEIDPNKYELLIHGMVERPLVLSLADLKRFPATSRICFIECSGNGFLSLSSENSNEKMSPQTLDGLISTSEWIGVSLALLLKEVGLKPGAKWLLAEGGDAAVLTRSVPIEKALEDSMIAYGQNGEAIRPEQGYPARLLLPGYEGSANVKWLRRIEVSDQPFMTREETSKYTDVLKDGKARMFTLEMGVKSLITFPSFPYILPEKGWWEIRGYAWSGAGKIAKVEVSTDGGKRWQTAELQQPILSKCQTRFRFLWNWDGEATSLMSRATDEKGQVQLLPKAFFKTQGPGTFYHNNQVRAWQVKRDGTVLFDFNV